MRRSLRLNFASLLRENGGSMAAEFALVVPLLLALLFGTTEFGRFMWMRNSLQSGVEAASRCSALDIAPCTTTAGTQAYAVQKSMGVNVPPATFTVSTEACGRVVTASYPFASITPLIPLNATISARACRSLTRDLDDDDDD